MIAKTLAMAGAEVVINGRRAPAIDAALARLKTEVPGSRVSGLACDVGTAPGCEALVAAHPHADIFINNVGIYGTEDFFTSPDAEWTRYFEVNVMSGVRLARAYIPGMKRKYWGRVIFMSSEWTLDCPSNMIQYGFSKAAASYIAHALAHLVSVTGVTVNSLLLGLVSSGTSEGGSENICLALEETISAFNPGQQPRITNMHAVSASSVAEEVLKLCSDAGAAISGASIKTDDLHSGLTPTTHAEFRANG
jgi:NAD(P)-dependent dehydrogenase (short-subunit alcohol dehydrogenase family)